MESAKDLARPQRLDGIQWLRGRLPPSSWSSTRRTRTRPELLSSSRPRVAALHLSPLSPRASTSSRDLRLHHGACDAQQLVRAAGELAALHDPRIARIAPLYWLLTSVMIVLFARSAAACGGRAAGRDRRLLSLHPASNPEGQAFPMLVTGWTLNYERRSMSSSRCSSGSAAALDRPVPDGGDDPRRRHVRATSSRPRRPPSASGRIRSSSNSRRGSGSSRSSSAPVWRSGSQRGAALMLLAIVAARTAAAALRRRNGTRPRLGRAGGDDRGGGSCRAVHAAPSRGAELAGDLSYAIYLVHLPVVLVLQHLLRRWPDPLVWFGLFPVLVMLPHVRGRLAAPCGGGTAHPPGGAADDPRRPDIPEPALLPRDRVCWTEARSDAKPRVAPFLPERGRDSWRGPIMDDHLQAKDEALLDDIRLLGQILGETVREQEARRSSA